MLAYKTFAQCPIELRPPGIDLNVPWQQQRIVRSEAATFSANGWTVIEEVSDIQPVQLQPGTEVIPRAPKNEYTMQAWGAKKGRFVSSDYACSITLSARSVDGLTFTYDMGASSLVPRVGDYIFQDNFCARSWITAIDTVAHTVTMDSETVRAPLEEGAAHYSRGYWLSVDVPGWFNPMQLWGCMLEFYFTNGHTGKDDFIELSIVDGNDFFKDDTFCQAFLGMNAADVDPVLRALGWDLNGEYGHWTKYYDESWVSNIDGKLLMTPDGAPGELVPHFETRISLFTSLTDNTVTEVFLDYMPTARI
jgi:hypothetical protein